MPHVLIVDDDPAILEILRAYLEPAGHEVRTATDGFQARDWLAWADVAVLDWMLPGVSGVALAQEARAAGLDLPLLLLTARGEEEDRLRGLDSGADDYLVKPFSPREVVARVRALLRRAGVQGELRVGGLHLDLRRRQVTLDGEALDLSRLEFELLGALAQHPGLVWSRTRLLERLWGPGYPGTERVVDVHITALRRKLGDDAERPRLIETVRGVGYRLREHEART
ncbi:response regulator transcription factor [Deinococcus hohokamensis]|uniref:Response regulator transcription factor n=1 Tax=Deinococcus hohokamensis TaxID=309883 RepID=A0ABV9I7Y6_9DEIO